MDLVSLDISVELRLDPTPDEPDVRFWVDFGFSGPLRGETELSLSLKRRWCWSGALVIDRGTPFFYRLGISAQAGTDWSLRIRDAVRGVEVLADGDFITTPKCWLLGACSLSSGEERFGANAVSERLERQPVRGAKVIELARRRLPG